MPRPSTGRVLVTVRLDPDDFAWLTAAAKQRDIGRSECLRRLVTAARRSGELASLGYSLGPVERETVEKVAAGVAAGHAFRPSLGNTLRCTTCGGRLAEHKA